MKNMRPLKFSLAAYKDPASVELVNSTEHRVLARWAIDCAERVMPYFEKQYPNDPRPRQALLTLQEWIDTGTFSMKVIRGASLASHTAAREVREDCPARSAARAAGQAVATAHVPLHALGAANYALQALFRATEPSKVTEILLAEREWQMKRLRDLSKNEQAKSEVLGK